MSTGEQQPTRAIALLVAAALAAIGALGAEVSTAHDLAPPLANPGSVVVPPTANPSAPPPGLKLPSRREPQTPQQIFPKPYEPRYIPGIGKGQVGTDGTIRVRRSDGSFLYTHGVDSVTASVGSGAGVPLPTPYTGTVCRDRGHRIQLVYAHRAGTTPRTNYRGVIGSIIWRAATKVSWEALRSSDGARNLSLITDCPAGAILPSVERVQIQGQPNASSIRGQVEQQLGFPRWGRSVLYLIFSEDPDPTGAAAGVAFTPLQDTHALRKDEAGVDLWAGFTKSSIVFDGAWFSHVTLHELFHTMGAVGYGGEPASPRPPFGSGAGHCWNGIAVMCYADDGPFGDNYTVICPDQTPNGVSIDCLYANHFRADHRDSFFLDYWLEEHWNVAGAENRFVRANPPWDYQAPCVLCDIPNPFDPNEPL